MNNTRLTHSRDKNSVSFALSQDDLDSDSQKKSYQYNNQFQSVKSLNHSPQKYSYEQMQFQQIRPGSNGNNIPKYNSNSSYNQSTQFLVNNLSKQQKNENESQGSRQSQRASIAQSFDRYDRNLGSAQSKIQESKKKLKFFERSIKIPTFQKPDFNDVKARYLDQFPFQKRVNCEESDSEQKSRISSPSNSIKSQRRAKSQVKFIDKSSLTNDKDMYDKMLNSANSQYQNTTDQNSTNNHDNYNDRSQNNQFNIRVLQDGEFFDLLQNQQNKNKRVNSYHIQNSYGSSQLPPIKDDQYQHYSQKHYHQEDPQYIRQQQQQQQFQQNQNLNSLSSITNQYDDSSNQNYQTNTRNNMHSRNQRSNYSGINVLSSGSVLNYISLPSINQLNVKGYNKHINVNNLQHFAKYNQF